MQTQVKEKTKQALCLALYILAFSYIQSRTKINIQFELLMKNYANYIFLK